MYDVLVSIIIPVYNVKPYLRQCLDSVIGQTYENLEILVVNDGSTDGCGDACDDYAEKDRRIRVFHTENRGLSAARNLGLDEASGEYIAFLDSDDWLELNAIENMVDAAIESDADIVCFRYVREYKNASKEEGVAYNEKRVFASDDVLREYCTGGIIGGATWDKLYKRNIFSTARFPENRYYEDIATSHRFLLEAKKVICIPEILIHYRTRKSGISRSHDLKNIHDQWMSTKERYEDIAKVSPIYANCLLESCIDAIGRMWSWYCGFNKNEKKNAKHLLESMQMFSAIHRDEIMKNSNISVKHKAICLCASTKNHMLMTILYLLNRIRRIRGQEAMYE